MRMGDLHVQLQPEVGDGLGEQGSPQAPAVGPRRGTGSPEPSK